MIKMCSQSIAKVYVYSCVHIGDSMPLIFMPVDKVRIREEINK